MTFKRIPLVIFLSILSFFCSIYILIVVHDRAHLCILHIPQLLAVLLQVLLGPVVLLVTQVVVHQEVQPDLQERITEHQVVGHGRIITDQTEQPERKEKHQSRGHHRLKVHDIIRHHGNQFAQHLQGQKHRQNPEKWVAACHLHNWQVHCLAQKHCHICVDDSGWAFE